ncbi:uncharacterized protein LOC133197216 [Saccostrea echinata]|uniref:uncharacterized protein LOC133197216 n=1 Tax=Saccostrea echinata TaxID=191078 RepID=UPI002A7EA7AE|nr:uncharacterized protein LOC133197216 [Saccostrea echinata]
MSCCTKCGVSKTRVFTLILLGVAITIQSVSVALPVWSEINTNYFKYTIRAHQNLWTVEILEDGQAGAFPKEKSKMNVGWKKDLQNVEVTCIVAGLLGLFTLLLSSVTRKMALLSGICRLLGLCFSLLAAIEVLVGSLLYEYQHKEIFSINAKDPKNYYPTDKLELSSGFFISATAGALYAVVVIVEIVVLAANNVKSEKEKNMVTSFA